MMAMLAIQHTIDGNYEHIASISIWHVANCQHVATGTFKFK